jgi:pyruvate/2-oxoglutarate dehydrogenase complex dihydrolipoamide dehydrogenase (E3) component
MTEVVDVVVIGLGPGSEEVAAKLAEAGLSVVGIDHGLVGGECPYWGCIPSKAIIRAANALEEARRVPGLAGASTVTPAWAPVARRIREMTDSWDDRRAIERLERKGGRFVRGTGRLDGPGRVAVDGTVFEARRAIVVNTGTSAVIPPIPGLAEVKPWTNRELVETETLPASLVVLGGGTIGLELAQAVHRFGVSVRIVEADNRLLGLEEPETSAEILRVLEEEGLDVHLGTSVERVAVGGEGVTLEAGDVRVSGEKVLVATGRRANLSGIGLETIGLDPSAKAIEIDDDCRAAPGVWAMGDCTGKGAFTHVATYQGRIVVADILGRTHAKADYHALPRVTFTDPEIGTVGLTEVQARERGISVRTGKGSVATSTRGWIHGPGNAGFMKLVEDSDRGVLVGATSMGPWGGEVMSMLSVAVHAAVPAQTLREMIWAYPTFHRGIEDALADLS